MIRDKKLECVFQRLKKCQLSHFDSSTPLVVSNPFGVFTIAQAQARGIWRQWFTYHQMVIGCGVQEPDGAGVQQTPFPIQKYFTKKQTHPISLNKTFLIFLVKSNLARTWGPGCILFFHRFSQPTDFQGPSPAFPGQSIKESVWRFN